MDSGFINWCWALGIGHGKMSLNVEPLNSEVEPLNLEVEPLNSEVEPLSLKLSVLTFPHLPPYGKLKLHHLQSFSSLRDAARSLLLCKSTILNFEF
ncbi:hypothetical protein [Nostoc sp. LPT]|uniref:hypothetical protein n=1 Tax=Nostoc sp. LPT TaxID=2815387 RepID=UPI001D74A158|nr:hypothetical protein [Nostoc sp. LPT]MBN4001412.1 hypothetical protein [Nostoc sp. LPT]